MTFSRVLLSVTLAAVVGGATSGLIVVSLTDGQTGPIGPPGRVGMPGPRGPSAQSPLHGAYVLSDSGVCPPGTSLANAEVSVGTNSSSGQSTFGLCYIK